MGRQQIRVIALVFCAGLLALADSSTAAPILVIGDVSDMMIAKNGSRVDNITGRVGAETSVFPATQGGRAAVYVFKLPDPPPGMQLPVLDATFQFTITTDRADSNYVIDLYGLNARADNTVLGTDYYGGPPPVLMTDRSHGWLIQNAIIPQVHPDNSPENVTNSGGDAASKLIDYLNAQYALDVGGPTKYVFLRLNPSIDPPNENTGVDVAFANNSSGKPQLSITFSPEPTALSILALLPLVVRGRSRKRSSMRAKVR